MAEQTLEQLKGRAYDLISMKEQVEAELRAINQQIGTLTAAETKAPITTPQDHKPKEGK